MFGDPEELAEDVGDEVLAVADDEEAGSGISRRGAS